MAFPPSLTQFIKSFYNFFDKQSQNFDHLEDITAPNNIHPQLDDKCLKEVFKYFKNDTKALYSCVSVSRKWCEQAIPLLWEDPFCIFYKNDTLVQTYLSCLSEERRTYLIENGLFIPESSNPKFNYPSHIRKLDYRRLNLAISRWLTNNNNKIDPKFICLISQELTSLIINQSKELHCLRVSKGPDNINVPNFSICTGFEESISGLRTFQLSGIFREKSEINHIDYLTSIISMKCRNIEHLQINISCSYESKIQKNLLNIVGSQKQLRKFECYVKNAAHFLLKLSCQAENLVELSLGGIEYNSITILYPLISCINLEKLKIFNYYDYTAYHTTGIESNRFHNLCISELYLIGASVNELFFEYLMRMVRSSLKKLVLDQVGDEKFLSIILKCPYLTHLALSIRPDSPNLPQLVNLNLEHLILNDSTPDRLDNYILNNIESFPDTLRHLDLLICISPNVLQYILAKCKFLETLGIYLQLPRDDSKYIKAVVRYVQSSGSFSTLRYIRNCSGQKLTPLSKDLCGYAKMYIENIVNETYNPWE
ncbi:30999_t:CDS:1 [Gigaspora margarita]|uniref:30999_t:CDS:1 n=1 Tax=Gigaspora margarita TaxID=4874 RepID=A0ABN7VZT1_GIGMA|nr:30999_t:CDS:1 [Gigaspora margarita]